jgi:hypothetical protein
MHATGAFRRDQVHSGDRTTQIEGPMSGEQKLGEGFLDLPLVAHANPVRMKDKA